MDHGLDPLVYDLVEWVAREPRTYADVMDAWRTSCPRLTVWEDAIDRGLLRRDFEFRRGAIVQVTDTGRRFLDAHRSTSRARLPSETTRPA